MSEEQAKESVDNVVDNAIENAAFEKRVADLDLVFDLAKSLQTAEERRTWVEELIGGIMHLRSRKKSTISKCRNCTICCDAKHKERCVEGLV